VKHIFSSKIATDLAASIYGFAPTKDFVPVPIFRECLSHAQFALALIDRAKGLSVRVRQDPDDQETNYDNRQDMRGLNGAVWCAGRAARHTLLASKTERASALDKVHPEAGGHPNALSQAEIYRFWGGGFATG